MRILVTGHLGYIGTVLTPILADLGYEVWGYDTGYYADCLLGTKKDSKISFQIIKDIRKVDASDLRGVEAVVHLAALSNDPTGELDPRLTQEINTNGTLRLAEIAREAGVKKYIFSSSCSIYGQSEEKALTEDSPFSPQTAYARSKVEAEAGLRKLASESFSPVFLRNATAYGFSSRLRFDIAVNNLTGWGYTTGQVKLMSDGRAWRPMVHVEDICQAITETLKAPKNVIHNQAFNVGSSQENYQIRDIANMVAQIVPNCKVTFAEGAAADNRTYNVSFEKIRRALPNFELRWSVRKGIEQLYSAFVSTSMSYPLFNGRLYTRLKQINYLLESGALNTDLFWKVQPVNEDLKPLINN
jgi:nucleoside-diphosphate-sugar epimerase